MYKSKNSTIIIFQIFRIYKYISLFLINILNKTSVQRGGQLLELQLPKKLLNSFLQT
jgi:hypothetical protein